MLKTSETYNLNSGLQQKLAGSLAAFNILLLVSYCQREDAVRFRFEGA